MELKVLGIIPARAGSKRLPNKNLRALDGKKLIDIAIENALNTDVLDHIVVSSDSQEILNLSERYDSDKITFLHRPIEISSDHSLAIEYVKHSLEYLKHTNEFDSVCIIQPSSPLTQTKDINGVINLFYNSGADSAVSIVKVAHDLNPVKLKVLHGDKLLPFIEEEKGRMSEQDLPEVYVRNCSVYVSKVKVINEGKIIGDDCRGYIMPRERSVDINDEFDLAFAEFLFQRNKIHTNE